MLAKALQRTLLISIGLCLVAQLGLLAQSQLSDPKPDTQVTGPVLGFLFAPQSGLTPLLGIPGAATWGPVVPLPGVEFAGVSIERGYALALPSNDGSPMIVRNLRGPAAISTVDASWVPVDEFVLSPGGEVAVLWENRTGRIRVVGGLPDAPALLWLSSMSTIPGELDAAVVADDGQSILTVVAKNQQRFLTLLTRYGGWRYLTALDGPSSVSYLRGASDALVADRDANQLYLVRDVAGSASMVPLAGEREGISRPIAVAVAKDNRHAIVLNSDPRSVTIVGLADGTAHTAPNPCVSAGLQQLAGDSVFLLPPAADSQFCVFDGDSSPPAVVVVPPPGDGVGLGEVSQ